MVIAGIFAASGLPPTRKAVTINVIKVPASRVGSGANPGGYVEQDWFSERNLRATELENLNLDFDHVYKTFIDSINEEGTFEDRTYIQENGEGKGVQGDSLKVSEAMAIASCIKYGEYGATTGKPRVCGPLDLPHLKHLVQQQNKKVSFSCIDRLDGLEKIAVVVGYEYQGEQSRFSRGVWYNTGDKITLDGQLPTEKVLKDCVPIYEVLDGWNNSKYEPGENLERGLERFFNYVQNKTGCKVISFGNGPETRDMVYLQPKDFARTLAEVQAR